MAIVYPELLERFSKMSYGDLWVYHKAAEHAGSVEAAIAAIALKRKQDPAHLTVFGLASDLFRVKRNRRFFPPGGHWKCIRFKVAAGVEGSFRSSDWKMISALVALAAFIALVFSKLLPT